MNDKKVLGFVAKVIDNMPTDWLNLTTHRLDIYKEELAKTEFLDRFEELFRDNEASTASLKDLPTAFDYIRLGHPLSSVLEWAVAQLQDNKAENVISFSSKTMPVLAILRKNLMLNKSTRILYSKALPESFDANILRAIYGYHFELEQVENADEIEDYDGTTVFISHQDSLSLRGHSSNIDFIITVLDQLGSILQVNGLQNEAYVSEIQHVRRRETIAMTPSNTLIALRQLVAKPSIKDPLKADASNKASALRSIKEITGSNIEAVIASSGLSMQYAIVMGLIHHGHENFKGKAIKIVVPPNCYGGTNDQARRVAACLDHVEVMDLPVDGGNDMARSIDMVLNKIANEDAVPYIIAEIPTNPRVEVPDLVELKNALSKPRTTAKGDRAVEPVFILDQTFCPNVHFLGENDLLSTVQTIAYVSGSKFPSGGKCTAGYCVANKRSEALMENIELHLHLCDNEATPLQMEILARQLPSMNERIQGAYLNTRDFVNFINETLPTAKINFVSEELASHGFTPSVFSLDLPTKGNSDEERESYKRALNLKLINMMISEIPDESKYCVSYGQLKGCYWTIPATSTQGTTKEGDKDYIARVALSPNMDLERHKKVFLSFVESI